MKFLKVSAITLLAVVLISWLASARLKEKQQSVVRDFTRSYINGCGQLEKFENLSFTAEQVSVFDGKLYLKERSSTKFLIHAFVKGKTTLIEEDEEAGGKIIQWGIQNDRLYAADGRFRSVWEKQIGSPDTDVFQMSLPFTRIIRLKRNKFLIKTGEPSALNEDFVVYDAITKKAKTFGNLLINYNDGGFANDGFFVANEDGNVFHVSYYQSDIIAFQYDGSPLYKTRTVDKSASPPATVHSVSGKHFISSMATAINKTAAANSSNLFIASSIITKEEEHSGIAGTPIIDVYNTVSGEYKGSIVLTALKNKKLLSLAATDDKLYCLEGSRLTSYNILPLNQ
jgi:hypothetical protein